MPHVGEFEIHPRHRIFADEWLTGEHTGKPFNGRAAFEYAGYTLSEKNPSANSSKLLRHPKVKAYLKERLEAMHMSAEEVLMRFSQVARFQMGDVLELDPVTKKLKINHEKALEYKGFIKEFKIDSNGNEQVIFHDSMRALENVGRVLGMFKDGLEVSGPGGAPVAMEVVFMRAGEEVSLGGEQEGTEQEDFSDLDQMAEVANVGLLTD